MEGCGGNGASADEARRLEERLRILSNATQAFAAASRSPERLFEVVVREIADTLQCGCALSLIAPDGAHFTTPYVHAADPEFLSALRTYLARGGAHRIDAHPGIQRVVETRQALFLPRIDGGDGADEELRTRATYQVIESARPLQIKSAIVVPLCTREKVIGALSLSRATVGAADLDEYDLALARSLAEHAALALETARLFEELEHQLAQRDRRAARLRLLAEASQAFSEATGDCDQLLDVIARRIGESIGDLCVIRLLNEAGTLLESGAVYHRDPELIACAAELLTSHPQRVGEGLMGRVAASGQWLLLPRTTPGEYAAATGAEYRPLLERLNVGSALFVPLVCRGKTVGVAALLRSGNENPYLEEDQHLLRSAADHAALAIANARSYAAERAAHTAAVNANAALHESERANRLLFEASPIPVIVFDIETLAYLAVNAAALQLYGYTYAEFMSTDVSELGVGSDSSSAKAQLLALGDAEVTGTVRHRRKDGSQLFAEYTSRALSVGGRRARIAVISDVTARHEAEQSRALLVAIVQSSNDAIVSKTLDGTITSWNGAAERLFGFSAEAAVGQSVGILIPPDRVLEERSLVASIARGERIEPHETLRRRKDGSLVAVSVSVAPIMDAAGRVIGASTTARDLTAQRRAEEALRHTEEQLRQSQKMEAVGRLAGGIAHDFNNLLCVILSYSQMLFDELGPGARMKDEIGEIRNAAARAADLTRQLLMFSRQQVVEPKVLDLNTLLLGMNKLLRRILGEDIDLVSVPGRGLGHVFADPSNVEQVIMNLVVNSRDAMPTGGKLTVETQNVELDAAYAQEHLGVTPGPHVVLAVSDTGIGMDPATRERIFDPFFTTKAKGKGTGLGLSTVFGIAQQCGGSIWVYSEPGQGTTFKVYFPRVDAAAEAEAPSQSPITLRGTETILLVEDQEQVRIVAQGILERNGYQLIVARNGSEALLAAGEHAGAIELLLTDVVMPQMSGAELAERLLITRPKIKVIYMSGYTDDSVVRHGVLESGMPFLQKPFTPESLARKVREVLNAPQHVRMTRIEGTSRSPGLPRLTADVLERDPARADLKRS